MMAEPADRFYESQGLRLHYVDWGNETAPPLILVHGGLDHCRNWDAIARELQPHFHVMAPDLRGHGDSEWAKGSSYSLADHVYDLSRLMRFAELQDAAIVGHSMGGMISLAYAGTYPDRVSRLAVLDGAFLSRSQPAPIHEQMSRWIDQLDRIWEREPSAFRTIEEAAQRLSTRNKRLTPALALHLARHGVRQGADGLYRWKFDHYQRARAPYRLSSDDYTALWSRITCPTLLMWGDESFLPDPEAAACSRISSKPKWRRSRAPDTGFIMTGSMKSSHRCGGFSPRRSPLKHGEMKMSDKMRYVRQLSPESAGEAPGRGRLQGRKILVVGGGQRTFDAATDPVGNGRAMSLLFAREGAHVAVADLNRASADDTVQRIIAEGGQAFSIEANIAHEADVNRMIDEAMDGLGGLDGMVLNVGIGVGALGLDGVDLKEWNDTFAVNLTGPMLCCRKALKHIADGSSIVFISSIAALRSGSQLIAYDASKAALGGLMRNVAKEGARRGIRANIIYPGLVDTPLGRHTSAGRPSRSAAGVPFGRMATGWEIAYAALFFISDESVYVNAQALAVDSGITGL